MKPNPTVRVLLLAGAGAVAGVSLSYALGYALRGLIHNPDVLMSLRLAALNASLVVALAIGRVKGWIEPPRGPRSGTVAPGYPPLPPVAWHQALRAALARVR